MSAGYPDDWASRSRRVKRADDWTCQVCGRGGGPLGNAELHAHHIIPKSKGGGHGYDNLTTLCDRCHAEFHQDPRLLASYEAEKGSIWGHFVVGVLTLWWSFGLGNVLYEIVASKRRQTASRKERLRRREGIKKLRKRAGQKTIPSRVRGFWHEKVDRGYNDEFDGCPSCSRKSLSVGWRSRGSKKVKVIECGSCGSLFKEKRVGAGLKLIPVDSVSEIWGVESGFDYELQKHLRMGNIDESELDELEQTLLTELDSKSERDLLKSKMRKFRRGLAALGSRSNSRNSAGSRGPARSESGSSDGATYQERIQRLVHDDDVPSPDDGETDPFPRDSFEMVWTESQRYPSQGTREEHNGIPSRPTLARYSVMDVLEHDPFGKPLRSADRTALAVIVKLASETGRSVSSINEQAQSKDALRREARRATHDAHESAKRILPENAFSSPNYAFSTITALCAASYDLDPIQAVRQHLGEARYIQ